MTICLFLKKHIFQEGARLTSHYCNTALCYPSRVSLLRGQLAHNTHVTDEHPPYGGFNDDYLPIWFKEVGYDKYYIGKIINQMTINNYKESWMKGWDDTDFLLNPFTYLYYNATFARNGGEPQKRLDKYSSDVIAEKKYALLDDIVDTRSSKESSGEATAPFFVTAPISAHTNIETDLEEYKIIVTDPQYSNSHSCLFKDVKLPRNENFNTDIPGGASWIRNLLKLNQAMENILDEFYRACLHSLQSVDEMTDDIFKKLEKANLLEDIYIIYSSDNGFPLETHRCGAGKGTLYEEDINFAFAIRGPGVFRNRISTHVSGHIGLEFTFFKLANIEDKSFFDGKAIPILGSELGRFWKHTQVEYWGLALIEHGTIPIRKALWLISDGYNLYYSTWCTGEIELYDMIRDPHQMQFLVLRDEHSRFLSFSSSLPDNFSTNQIITSPNALLLLLRDCKNDQCRHPWRHIHSSDGSFLEFNEIIDALDSKYDDFYASIEQVSFASCPNGHVLSKHGSQWRNDRIF
ncbi:alkaline phosphatase-like protein [Nadsonia fulvescens var. elongata DSM 6958]|uniref:Alkaline phosphatase-like protein n=1 Tax=Nadsonia fulvescens var. elongata DSM 6958 TaxID=857566 RepID=A0A1E3PCU4_9ASCO|nr:alkaline phosphatase-like protein [Nadsonia fulvescens var. elongata DSM 6958]